MNSKPSLFTGEMVRAITDGRKTQTRRVMRWQPTLLPISEWCYSKEGSVWAAFGPAPNGGTRQVCGWQGCPYGIPGDLLWVRERFRIDRPFTGNIDYDLTTKKVTYYADDHPKYRDQDRWKPSIHMPRALSRLTLRISNVRVERVQEITWLDARREGLVEHTIPACGDHPELVGDGLPGKDSLLYRTPIEAFAALRDSINAKRGYSWESNPWVWIIEWDKVWTQNIDEVMAEKVT